MCIRDSVIPLLWLGVLRSLGRISDYRIDDRRERFLPLLVGAVCYVLCAITIAKIPSAIFLRKFMVAAACCEVLCLVVSFYWKISLHPVSYTHLDVYKRQGIYSL